jgi:hypothetical protein
MGLFGGGGPGRPVAPPDPPTKDTVKKEADEAAAKFAQAHSGKAKQSTILTSYQGLKEEEEKYPKKKLKKTLST